MTRVYQVMAGAAQGGAEAFFFRLLPALAKAGIVQRAATRPHGDGPDRLRAAGIAVRELPFGGWFDWRTRPALGREIADFDPHIVLSWMSRATRFCPPGKAVHAARLGGFYDLKYYRHCDHLIGNSRALVAWMAAQGWPPERAHYLPNFASAARLPNADRAALDTPADAPLALALGRLHDNKAFDVLLEALAGAPGLWLWLAGDGPLRARLEAQAARLGVAGRVRFLGWRTDTAALYAAADMVVCPSRHEPLGNVILEAWAQEKPVIAAAASGPAELIESGRTGLLVPIDDAGALGWALRDVAGAKGLAGDLAAAGRAQFEAEFSEARVVARYGEFFDKVRL